MKEPRPEDRRHVAASDRPPDEAALREVITRYGPMILATCRRILGDAQVAEDAAQVTLLAFYRKAPGLSLGPHVGTWLYQTARLSALMARRQEALRRRHEQEAARERTMENQRAAQDAAAIDLNLDEALRRLSSKLREAVVLRYLSGMSQEETARHMGCSVSAASMCATRGLEKLRRHLVRAGFSGSALALAALMDQARAAELPAGFADKIVSVCAGKLAAGASAMSVLHGVESALWWAQIKWTATIAAGIIALAGALGFLIVRGPAPAPTPAAPIGTTTEAAAGPAAPATAAAPVLRSSLPQIPDVTAASAAVQRLETPAGTYSRYALVIEKALADGRDCPVVLYARDTTIVQGFSPIGPGYDGSRYPGRAHDFSRLAIAGDRLSGRITLARDTPLDVGIDAEIVGRRIAGAYATAAARGVVTGARLAESELRRLYGVPAGKDWPEYLGPHGNLTGVSAGLALIDRVEDMRLLWRSEAVTPPSRSQDKRYGGGLIGQIPSGGNAGPIVADGRVYLYYFSPCGDVIDEGWKKEIEGRGGLFVPDLWRVSADDVLICMDAATGQTLWKSVWPDHGLNLGTVSKTQRPMTPCVAAGKVCVLGSAGRIYCLDAKTGKPLWDSNIGAAHRRLEEQKKKGLESRRVVNCEFETISLTFAGGTFLCAGEDWLSLLAVDTDTGKPLWSRSHLRGRHATPLRWTHQGRQYLLVANDEGYLRCVEPRTGKDLWTVSGVGYNTQTITGRGDRILVNVGGDGFQAGKPPVLGCYRVDLGGAERIWVAQEISGDDFPTDRLPILYEDRVYVRGHEKLFCVDMATGRILARQPCGGVMSAFALAADGRVLVDVDGMQGRTLFQLFNADPARFERLGAEQWLALHPMTSAYARGQVMHHAYADGRLFVRGYNGIYCYDLRKTDRP